MFGFVRMLKEAFVNKSRLVVEFNKDVIPEGEEIAYASNSSDGKLTLAFKSGKVIEVEDYSMRLDKTDLGKLDDEPEIA